MKTFLLFGAEGLFGTEFELCCHARGFDVIPLRRADCDITDQAQVEAAILGHRPDVVVNAAGMIDIDRCEMDPAGAFAVHCRAAIAMAEAAERIGAIHVQTGTHLIFDGTAQRPYVESDLPAPGTVYAATKLAAESLAAWRCSRNYSLRFPTLYGRRRNRHVGFVDRMVEMLSQGRTVRVADDRIDTVTFAGDAAGTLLDLVIEERPWGIYHVANDQPQSYFDAINEINQLLGSPGTVLPAKDAEFRKSIAKPVRVPLASQRIRPLRNWRDAMREYSTILKAA
ncbi:NAD(P)-dependent oxidoreductase [Azospirillum sp. B506]|uniref:SDR family oxidoreductase n=1 Tax=Azospirillum sp. B506 TaxID=137721 RepID=UPI00131F10EF|nr:NAD(P)-dependent oxidoreductase [Azospirillum sp. B506]